MDSRAAQRGYAVLRPSMIDVRSAPIAMLLPRLAGMETIRQLRPTP
jgi:hypothetical protein